jgi:hypothetical protein
MNEQTAQLRAAAALEARCLRGLAEITAARGGTTASYSWLLPSGDGRLSRHQRVIHTH